MSTLARATVLFGPQHPCQVGVLGFAIPPLVVGALTAGYSESGSFSVFRSYYSILGENFPAILSEAGTLCWPRPIAVSLLCRTCHQHSFFLNVNHLTISSWREGTTPPHPPSVPGAYVASDV